MDDLIRTCDKKYADKAETKKALKALEKNVSKRPDG
jgi:hypothetical protein